jgi:hypothetical protein
MLTISEAIDDASLFGPWFSGPSWALWRAILKGAFAIPMSEAEIELFRGVTERDPPKKRVRELWIVAGRRAGKDSIASLIAAWFAAFENYGDVLRPGETANVLCLAVDKTQAKIVLNYTRAYFERVEMLRPLVTREVADGLMLSTGAEIAVLSSNYRSVRGRSIALAIMDEVAFMRSEESSASPDVETYAALVPGLATIPGSMLIGMSSPYRRGGLLYEKWRAHYGKPDDDVLVVRAASRTLNPTLDQKIVDDEMARDPAKARAEYLAEWRDDVGAFLSHELIDAAVDFGIVARAPIPGVIYHGACDPSGGVSDSFTAAVAHAEGDSVILDCLVEIPAPLNPSAAVAAVAEVMKSYRSSLTGDRYSAGFVVDAFAKHGLTYKHSERDRSAIYADALPLFTSGRARLLDNKRLVSQFASLERRVTPIGRDRIDHPRGSGHHDDSANSAALALVLAAATSRAQTIPFVAPQFFRLAQPRVPEQGSPRYASGDVASVYADQRCEGFSRRFAT